MSKVFLFVFLQLAMSFYFQAEVFAIQFEFVGIDSHIIYRGEKKAEPNQSVGSFTLKVLEDAKARGVLDFTGSEAELRSINDLATDSALEDYEIISDEEMNTYGWCFTLDSVLPHSTPNHVHFSSDAVTLRWYYAYAHYNRGWQEWCIPVRKKRQPPSN